MTYTKIEADFWAELARVHWLDSLMGGLHVTLRPCVMKFIIGF